MTDTDKAPRIWVDLAVIAALLAGLCGCAWLVWVLLSSEDALGGGGTAHAPSVAGATSEDRGPASPGGQATAQTQRFHLVLPDDATELALHPHYGIENRSLDTLRLRVDRFPVPVRIAVRRGAVFGSRDPHTSARVAAADVTLDVEASGSVTISTLILDPARATGDGAPEVPHQLASPEVLAWLDASAAERWSVRQTGLWMLTADVSPEAFGALRVARANLFAPEASSSSRIAGYTEIVRAAQLLSGDSLDPARFALYRHVREYRDRLVAEASLDAPGTNAESVMVNKTLRPYAGEPDVEALLLRYLERDEPAHVVSAAFELLAEAGMPSTSNDALYAALADDRLKSQRQRFLHAVLLFTRLDPRGLPLLVAFEPNATLFGPYAKAVERRINAERKVDEVGRTRGESLFDYLVRDSAGPTVDPATMELARRLHQTPDEILARALADLASGDARRTRTGLAVVVRYTNSTAAFEAVAARALAPDPPGASNEALAALPRFENHPLGPVYARILASLSDANRAGFAMSSLVRARFPEREALLETALTHVLSAVRGRALTAMTEQWIASHAVLVLALVESDPTLDVRALALQRLATIRYPPLLVRIGAWLQAPTPRERRAGLAAAQAYGNSPDALELLEPYRSDPLIGREVTKYLERIERRR